MTRTVDGPHPRRKPEKSKAVSLPTPSQLHAAASEVGLDLTDADVTSFIELMRPRVAAYNIVDAMPDNLPEVRYPRTPGYRPMGEENAHNAWYVKTRVEGASSGKLRGRTVVLKDNIMLAGVPMMNGSATLEGYMPDIDVTVVQRVLDAGGTIVGKAHCEAFCLSGGSHTNATGPVHNPHRIGYSAGGSSSGSAVLVARGEADMALGGDQGGSIRMPSSFCGTYGMKPTHGLVPYTGIMPIEIYDRPHRPDDPHRRRQCAVAGGSRRAGRLRPAAIQSEDATLCQHARRRREGHADWHRHRGVPATQCRGRREHQSAGRRHAPR